MRLTRHIEGDAFYRGQEVYDCAVCRIGRLGTLRQAVCGQVRFDNHAAGNSKMMRRRVADYKMCSEAACAIVS
jgi:hypothetical protein